MAGKGTWWEEEESEWTSAPAARGNAGLKRALANHPPPAKQLKRGAAETSGGPPGPWALQRTASASSWSDDGWRSSIGGQDQADIQQWRECTRVGKLVPGTSIVPCKTPFEGPLADRAYEAGLILDEDWFGKDDLMQVATAQGTPIGLVIDLVNTQKYYTGFSEDSDGIEYQKFRIPGRTVPERAVLEEIFDRIDEFVARRPDEFVAVHCTHGVNRTGFLIAAYLMTRAHLPKCRKAVAAFEKARGCKMDKEYLLEALMDLEEGKY